MLYARDVIDLMAAYPGRDFRMAELYRYVANGRNLDRKRKRAVREALLRVLKTLEEAGSILVAPPQHQRGSYAVYRWKVTHEPLAECHA